MSEPGTGSWWSRSGFVLTALLLLAWNLRPTAVGVGPVLGTLSRDLGMNAAAAGLLTALPSLCFAGFGVLTPMLAGQFGRHRVITVALACVAFGSLARTYVGGAPAFLVLSGVALAGMAAANVLMPSLVKEHFPARVGIVTSLYTTVLSIGLAVTSTTVAPLAVALHGWRPALRVLAVVAVVALVVWLGMLPWDRGHHAATHRAGAIRLRDVARTRLGWVLAIFFGLQSSLAYSVFGWLASIYVGAGFTPTVAGLYLGLATGLGIPLSFVLPAYVARHRQPYAALSLIVVSAVIGFGGLVLAPGRAPGLWAVFVALGTASFPMILALLGLRARTAQGTAALSGFAQGVGYLIAAICPFLIGVLRQATGGFHWPLVLLLASLVPFTIAGFLACRDGYIEDELPAAKVDEK